MDSRNVMYMVYGFSAIWLILFAYLIWLISRERSLNSELDRVKRMLEEERPKLAYPEIRVYRGPIDRKRIRDHLRDHDPNPSAELIGELSSPLEYV